MTTIKPTIKLFTTDDESSGIQVNSLILEHNGNHYEFHGGTNDIIHVFTESIAIYILTANRSNGTMGLSCFMSPQSDPINGIYLHTPGQIKERLGDNWDHMPTKAIVERLIDYLV